MTIKNTDKNVSAENHEDVVVNASFNNGILTLIRKNLYDESTSAQKNIEVDLSDHKLKLKVLENEAELRALETSNNQTDIKDRQTYVFLTPFESDEEGIYREHIWVEDENNANGGKFEVIGSTRVDLTNYIQKSQINGLIKNTGEIDTTSYASDSELNSAINGLESFLGARISSLELLKIIKREGNYYLDVSGTQKGATIEIPDITGKEDVSNKVTAISSSSTNTQYPSAKAVYDALQNNTELADIAYTGDYEDLNSFPINHIDDGDITSQPANDMFYITSTEQIEVPTPSFITLNVDNSFTGADNLVMNITLSSNQTGTLKDTSGNTLTYGDCKGLGTILVYILSDRDFILFSPNTCSCSGGEGLDPQEISDAAEAVGEYNNPDDGSLQNTQKNLLLCVKLPIMPNYQYENFNIRINEDNSGFYWYTSENNNRFKEYLFADDFVGRERNYSVYLVDPSNNPETDTTFLIGTIDLNENTYTVNGNTYNIEIKTILIDLSTLNLSGNGGNGGNGGQTL